MNSWFGRIVFITVIVSIAVLFVTKFSPPIPISSVVTQKTDLFTVSGEGKVTVIPDTAIINLGITVSRPSVKLAQNDANTVINKISTDVKKMGVESKDIRTGNYSIYPQYNYNTQPAKINGYQVTASLTITVRDFDKINQVIDTSTADGANTVNGIQLTVDEDKQKELLKQAREEAVKDAKAKAESLASAAGITLGRIVNIQESGNTPVPQPRMFAADAVGLGSAEKTSIEPGSADITSAITLFYETR